MFRAGKIFSGILILFLLSISFKVEATEDVDWNNLTVTASGKGFSSAGMSGEYAKAISKRVAIVNAYRRLAEIINGVNVTGETTVENMTISSDIVKIKVEAVIKGAKVISEKEIAGGYEVTLQLPIFNSSGGLASAVIEKPAEIIPFPEPEISVESQKGGVSNYTVIDGGKNSPMSAKGNYTGLIVDCRGFNLNPVMSPIIKNTSGTKLYGHKNLNYDLVIADGMASYAENMNETARAGNNPLIIKAERLEDNNANPVINVDDGNRILIENGATGFLNTTAVVFLK